MNKTYDEKQLLIYSIIFFSIIAFCSPSYGSICSEVKIEVRQEMTLERQAFDAHMRINNGLSHITLENIKIDVSFQNENREIVKASNNPDNEDALFFIRLDTMENINHIDGNGIIQPATSADIHWLIIPAYGASNGTEQGTLYYVGAKLTYTIGGEEHVTEVTPDYIFVKPMPMLVLDYFLPVDVYGDDAFTDEIEPSIPFTLGLRIKNVGFGTAINLKIDSAKPVIVDNEQGLLVDFVITDCEIDNIKSPTTLLANFGNIAPETARIARWFLTCPLSGSFNDFKTTFIHSDELGGELTSLIDSTNPHKLIHDVLVDLPGRDNIKDFLAFEGLTYTVYESEYVDSPVVNQSLYCEINQTEPDIFELSTPITKGLMYVKLEDPFFGEKHLSYVQRSDGKQIDENNAWISKKRDDKEWQYYIHLFDSNTTEKYTFFYETKDNLNVPPVLQFISNKNQLEGNRLSFIVESSDPNNTTPNLKAISCPYGSHFIDNKDGTGIFEWTPEEGQAGDYQVTFIASDDHLKTNQRVRITINSATDTDGDNILDEWEMLQFGNLNRDGSGDMDRDGLSDFEEFQNNSDPNLSDIDARPPIADAGPDQLINYQHALILSAINSTDPDNDIMSYEWKQINGPIIELSDAMNITTSFAISEHLLLTDCSFRFQLTVTDITGLVDHDYCIVNISNTSPPPVAQAGDDQAIDLDVGEIVLLDGSNSSDSYNDITSYFWEQISGFPVNLINSNTALSTFYIPEVGQDGASLTFRLTIVNEIGQMSSDTCIVNIIRDNLPPTAIAQTGETFREGEIVSLNALDSTDPDNKIFFYKWHQLSGIPIIISDPVAPTPTFIAPDIGEENNIELEFQLTVMDSLGMQSSTSLTITIIQANIQPIAFHDTITIAEDNHLTYTLNAFDEDENSLTYEIIEYPKKASLSFVDSEKGILLYSPELNEFGYDSFSFKVNDGTIDSEPAQISIYIKPVNDIPEISEIDHQAINEDEMLQSVLFTISDIETPIDDLMIQGTASNKILIPNNNINIIKIDDKHTITILPALNQSGVSSITISVSDDADTAIEVFRLTVNAVADPPELLIEPEISGLEDSDIPITIRSLKLLDDDGSEHLNHLTISGIPQKAILSAGTKLDNGDYIIPIYQIDQLTVLPELNNADNFMLTITAMSNESENNDTAYVHSNMYISLTPVADQPVLNTSPTISGYEDSCIQLHISPPKVFDKDNSEKLLPIQIFNIPENAMLTSGIKNNDSTWTVSFNEIESLCLTPAFNNTIDFTVTVYVTSQEIENNDTATLTKNIFVDIIPVNDPPEMSQIPDQYINENESTTPIIFSIKDIETPSENLIIAVSSTNQELVPDTNIQLGGAHSNRFLKISPAYMKYGQSTILITLTDESKAITQTFDLIVKNVVLPGDFDDNGLIQMDDIQIALAIISGNYNGVFFIEADTDGDAKINLADLIYTQQYIANLPHVLDINNDGYLDLNDLILIFKILANNHVEGIYPEVFDNNPLKLKHAIDLFIVIAKLNFKADIIPGDFDNNGFIQVNDLQIVLEIIAGSYSGDYSLDADVNSDKCIDIKDAIYIQQVLEQLNQDPELNCNQKFDLNNLITLLQILTDIQIEKRISEIYLGKQLSIKQLIEIFEHIKDCY